MDCLWKNEDGSEFEALSLFSRDLPFVWINQCLKEYEDSDSYKMELTKLSRRETYIRVSKFEEDKSDEE